jgi:hypothetical protein
VSTTFPALMAWIFPGAAWFHHELIPSSGPLAPGAVLDPRTLMAVWQLANCLSGLEINRTCLVIDRISLGYLLLGLISTLVFRAARDALPHDPVAQERIIGASLSALAVADVSALLSFYPSKHSVEQSFRLPSEI